MNQRIDGSGIPAGVGAGFARGIADCQCCAQRGLYVYRADCLRCMARDLARLAPGARREAWRIVVASHGAHAPEWVGALRRLVREESVIDLRSGAVRYEGRA